MKVLRPLGIVALFWLGLGSVLLPILIPVYYTVGLSIWPPLMFFLGVGVAILDWRRRSRMPAAANAARGPKGNSGIKNAIKNPTGVQVGLSLLLLWIPFCWPLTLYMVLRYGTGHRTANPAAEVPQAWGRETVPAPVATAVESPVPASSASIADTSPRPSPILACVRVKGETAASVERLGSCST